MSATILSSTATSSPGSPPVLFLDIDDVMCLNDPYTGSDALRALDDRHPHAQDIYRHLFARTACDVLHRLHQAMDGQLRYVISSSWRDFLGRDDLWTLFRRAGMPYVAAALHRPDRWCTPPNTGRGARVDDIAAWPDRHHQGEPFAIVDDLHSGASLQPALYLPDHPFRGRVVLCEESGGLRDEHLQTLVDALNRPALSPPSLKSYNPDPENT